MKFVVDSWSTIGACFRWDGIVLKQTEREELANLKRFLVLYRRFALPLTIMKRDRPDFEISADQETVNIGLEHTWVAHEAWEQAEQHMLNTKEPRFEAVSRNWLEGSKQKGTALGKYVATKQGSMSVWGAREQAEAKAAELCRAMARKAVAFASDGFAKFPENWLLVTDKSPFLFLDVACFEEALVGSGGYSKVFFLTESYAGGSKTDALFEVSPERCTPMQERWVMSLVCQVGSHTLARAGVGLVQSCTVRPPVGRVTSGG